MNSSPFEQFEVKLLSKISLFGLDLSMTNLMSFLILAHLILVFFLTAVNNEKKYKPTNWQAVVESIYLFIVGLVKEQSGKRGIKFFPFFFTIFNLNTNKINKNETSYLFVIPFTSTDYQSLVSKETVFTSLLFTILFIILQVLISKGIIVGYFKIVAYYLLFLVVAHTKLQLITTENAVYFVLLLFAILLGFFFKNYLESFKNKFMILVDKADDMIYGDFFEKNKWLGRLNFIRIYVISLIGYQFERKKGFLEFVRIYALVFLLSFTTNLYLLFIFGFGCVLVLHSTRRKYKRNLNFNNYTDENLDYFKNKLYTRTLVVQSRFPNFEAKRKIGERGFEAFMKALDHPGKVSGTFLLLSGLAGVDSYNRALLHDQAWANYHSDLEKYQKNPNGPFPDPKSYFNYGYGDGLGHQFKKTMQRNAQWRENGGKYPWES